MELLPIDIFGQICAHLRDREVLALGLVSTKLRVGTLGILHSREIVYRRGRMGDCMVELQREHKLLTNANVRCTKYVPAMGRKKMLINAFCVSRYASYASYALPPNIILYDIVTEVDVTEILVVHENIPVVVKKGINKRKWFLKGLLATGRHSLTVLIKYKDEHHSRDFINIIYIDETPGERSDRLSIWRSKKEMG